MTSLFDQAIKDGCDRAFTKMLAPGGWLRERIRRDVKWLLHGFEPGFDTKDRERFTKTVADRIHEKARQRLTLCGVRLWLVRQAEELCAEQAEQIVTDWLDEERIKFGDPRFCWVDGRDLADAEAMDLPDDELLSWNADGGLNLCVGDLRALLNRSGNQP